MSRDIKFRAWAMGAMRYNVWPTGKGGYGRWQVRREGSETAFVEAGTSKAVLMQYTGRKDRDGVEIYEGDIVKMDVHKDNSCKDNSCADYYEDPDPVEGYYVGKVTIRASVGVCLVKPLFHDELDDSVRQVKVVKGVRGYRSKVIGNIHENPELVKP